MKNLKINFHNLIFFSVQNILINCVKTILPFYFSTNCCFGNTTKSFTISFKLNNYVELRHKKILLLFIWKLGRRCKILLRGQRRVFEIRRLDLGICHFLTKISYTIFWIFRKLLKAHQDTLPCNRTGSRNSRSVQWNCNCNCNFFWNRFNTVNITCLRQILKRYWRHCEVGYFFKRLFEIMLHHYAVHVICQFLQFMK